MLWLQIQESVLSYIWSENPYWLIYQQSVIFDLRLSPRWNWCCSSFVLWYGVILYELQNISGSSGLIKIRILVFIKPENGIENISWDVSFLQHQSVISLHISVSYPNQIKPVSIKMLSIWKMEHYKHYPDMPSFITHASKVFLKAA